MSTYTDEFLYDDLSETDSIRLLILHPGTLGSPIQSDLIHTTLHECRCDIHGNYTALSYVWGDANDTTYIFVNGFRFTITVNLAAALHDLRDEKRQLRLWADAACINQINNIERSQQVGLMREVYSYAQNTVIYLGALVEQTKCLFELMHQRDPDRTKLLGIVDDAIIDIVSRPWFTRVWVYQELVLSNTVFVQVGRMRVSWDYLCEAMLERDRDPRDRDHPSKTLSMPMMDTFYDKSSDIEPRAFEPSSMIPTTRETQHDHDTRCQSLWTMYEARRNYQSSIRYGGSVLSFLGVLVSRRGSKASDPRDMIYGHLAVVDLELKHEYDTYNGSDAWPIVRNRSLKKYIPVVDYTKSVEEVFTEAARFTSSFRSADGLLKILHHADVNASYTRRSDLPSWVPDWRLDENCLQGLSWFFDETDTRNFSGVTQVELFPSSSIDGALRMILQMSSISTIPHILSFFYNEGIHRIDVVEKIAQIAVADELAYESARLNLIESVENMLKLRGDRRMSKLIECNDVFRSSYSLWQSLGAKDMYPIPSEDLSLSPATSVLSWLSRNVQYSMMPSDSFKTPSKPYPHFLVNIIIIALRGRASLDIFRGMKFAKFSSGRVGVVPMATERGDFTLTEIYEDCSRNCCMFRPKEDPNNEAYNLDIRAEIDTGTEEVIPVQHCTYVGKAWVEDSPSWENMEERMSYYTESFEERSRRLKIIAVH
ncbi:hypothetical protein EAE96_001289 [Botrytis aclada]|nr:hypothetical protein EAE96_001289 [Botrytis aclada]